MKVVPKYYMALPLIIVEALLQGRANNEKKMTRPTLVVVFLWVTSVVALDRSTILSCLML